MNSRNQSSFPGGSKGKVNRAGNNARINAATTEDYKVIDEWRAAHRSVLNTFQAILRTRTQGTDIVVAQRHKRRTTIFNKLSRYPEMQLARMDDVAGCRIIFPDIASLYEFRNSFHSARFNHKLRNEIDKYDYIKRPKTTGYRGIHDVYVYDVKSSSGSHLKGLMLEIQYRTFIQHSWATAVEVIGFITENQPKFQQGDTRYLKVMALASEILARAFEEQTGPFPDIDDTDLVEQFRDLEIDLGLISMLQRLNTVDTTITSNKNAILIFSKSGELVVHTFKDAPEALKALFKLEKERPGEDLVLVRADKSEDVRIAFKNYFSDAREFLQMIEEGCQRISSSYTRDL